MPAVGGCAAAAPAETAKDAVGAPAAAAAAAAPGNRRVEDLLGGSGGDHVAAVTDLDRSEAIGGSEDLKSASAELLRVFPVEADGAEMAAAATAARPRKTVESSFGQRTSIYRGVTR